jgi:hypothetical protein
MVCQNISILHIFTLFSAQSSKATRLENALDSKQKESYSIHLNIYQIKTKPLRMLRQNATIYPENMPYKASVNMACDKRYLTN